ncbi:MULTISPECIES: CapA family protein [unclassified Nocardioides]|uniref:CapA family protein n=1 Tax=unclassified Nocardioides TaxID=2615069 RepID=UPI0009F0715C|nr:MULTISPECIES: CapA family protein [unclassified Nocardioides]GAW51579.1 Putative enzyme of poly-gamma-glutamate biosynthesis (Capsule formation) (Precursor) [Nocardioides sp. PD653-B2]GAW54880.1 putative enzyme of poly-gamma-glutamate biosynthesis (Capsule formation) (Precursor) [Nocardioides sp. PD653]
MPSRRQRLLAAITALCSVSALLVAALVGAWLLRPTPTPTVTRSVIGTPSATEPGDPDPSGSDPATTPARRTASIVMSGDLLWHNTVWASAAEDHARTGAGERFDFDPMFADMKPVVAAADVAICHEEVPIAAPGEPLHSYPVFAAPHQIAAWIGSMGWDACTTASNHSMDAGIAGIDETADLLEAAGVAHVGTFRSPTERRKPVIVTTDEGVAVAIVAATYGLNGYVLPAGHEWAVSQEGDVDGLLAQAHRAREAGADIVVAHYHWGTEYDHLPNADQVAIAKQLTASPDIDVVLGEHAHVVQPITTVNGKWVAYGMGNMVAQSEPGRPDAYEGITVELQLTERAGGGFDVSRIGYLPTQWNHYTPGNPIRIRRATGTHLASIRAAVDGVGRNAGLVED